MKVASIEDAPKGDGGHGKEQRVELLRDADAPAWVQAGDGLVRSPAVLSAFTCSRCRQSTRVTPAPDNLYGGLQNSHFEALRTPLGPVYHKTLFHYLADHCWGGLGPGLPKKRFHSASVGQPSEIVN